jgi:hypothetical protein
MDLSWLKSIMDNVDVVINSMDIDSYIAMDLALQRITLTLSWI